LLLDLRLRLSGAAADGARHERARVHGEAMVRGQPRRPEYGWRWHGVEPCGGTRSVARVLLPALQHRRLGSAQLVGVQHAALVQADQLQKPRFHGATRSSSTSFVGTAFASAGPLAGHGELW